MKLRHFFSIIAFVIVATTVKAQTITLQPDAASGKDALVQISDNLAYDGSTNFGANANYKASRTSTGGNWYKTRGLLQFDLSSIPANAIITSATLTLSGLSHSTAGQSNASILQRVTAFWDEQTVTWNNQPATTATSSISLTASTTSTQNYSVDVKTHVQDMVQNPAGNFGWMLKLTGEATSATAELYFASSDYTTDITKRPKLEITYLVLAFKQTAASTPTATNGAVDLTVTGGTAPYTYSWVNSAGTAIATTQDITGLLPGCYTVTVTDNASKQGKAYVLVGSKGTAVTISVQPDASLGNDVTLSAFDNGTNGDGSYATATTVEDYRWTNAGNWFKQRNLIAYDLSSIPPYAIITNAKLYLYGLSHATTGQTNASTLQRVSTPWTEGYVSWNTQPSVNTTGAIAVAGSTSSTQNYILDVTAHVQDMVHAPQTNYGWELKLNGEANSLLTCMVFASSDYTTDATKRPKLEITFYIPDNEETRNWVNVESFDNNGNVMTQSRSYTDALGRSTQQQSLDIENSNVLASQNVFDAFGRPALQTLSAPVFQGGIYFKDGFIKDASGNNYSYDDFDKPITTSNLTGEVNNPGAVNSATQGSLGWYYSNNNTSEPYVPASSYPYTRVEYYNDPTNRVKRTAAAGENHRMGSNNENEMYYMANAGELYYVFGYKGSAIVGLETSNAKNENLQSYKTITVDPDGKEIIQYTTVSGLPIATCRSGLTNSCVAQKVSQEMVYYGARGVDIHLPAAKKATLRLTIPGNAASYGINENVTTNPQQINYKIYDLKKEKLLVAGTDYTFDRASRYVTFINSYATGDGFFRISYDYTSTFLSFFDPTQTGYMYLPTVIPDLAVEYQLDYSEWSINFYNTRGQLVKSVQPEEINCTYNPISFNTIANDLVFKDILVASTGTYTHSENTTAVSGYDQEITFNVLLDYKSCSGSSGTGGSSSGTTAMRSLLAASSTTTVKFMSADALLDTLGKGGVNDQLKSLISNNHYGHGPITWGPLDPVTPPEPPWPPFNPNGAYGSTRYYVNVDFDLVGTVSGSQVVISTGHKIQDSPFGTRHIQETMTQAAKDGSTVYSAIGIRITAVHVDVYTFDAAIADYDPVPVTVAFDPANTDHTNMLCNFDLAIASQLHKYPTPTNLVYLSEPMVTTTAYNQLGWPIKSVSGDEGPLDVVYDNEGKIRFTQNYEQYLNGGKFTYYAYDRAGRVTETGEYDPTISSTGTILAFLPYNTDGTVPTYTGSGTSVHTIVNTLGWAYSNRSTQQTYSAYDVAQSDFPGTLTGYAQTYKDGQVAKSWNSKEKTWYGYDDLGRITWAANDITGLGIKTVNYSYTKDGQLDKMDYQKEVSGERFVHQYSYDANHRMKETKTSLDNTTFNSNQVLKYYLHGALKRNELGVTLQGLDYVYTINGWLKSMNDPTLSNRDPGKDSYTGVNSAFKQDVFGFTLDYFTGDYTRSGSNIETYTPATGGSNTALPENYSGTIRAARWQTVIPTGAPTVLLAGEVQYAYKYDNKNQLSEAFFGRIITGGATPTNGLSTTAGAEALFSEQANAYRVNNLSYDKNGNIQSLKRQGTPTAAIMDDLGYVYDATNHNRLLSITDAASPANNYSDDLKTQASNNYVYNNLGQLTKDVLSDYNYTYDVNGKVTAIKKTSGVSIVTMEYNAAGQREKKTDYDVSGNATQYTWYVYDAGGSLLSTYNTVVSTSTTTQNDLQVYGAGRIGAYLRTASYNVTNYVYEITDHLGNVRATFRNNAGNAEVLSFTDYYPHGSTMPNRNYVAATAYRFGYQGQEKDSETGFLNFELRQYDPRIGRWFNPDPMGQYFSPYLAMGNNPVSGIDPTGGYNYGGSGGGGSDTYFARRSDEERGEDLNKVFTSGTYGEDPSFIAWIGGRESYNHALHERWKEEDDEAFRVAHPEFNLPAVEITATGGFSYDVHQIVQNVLNNLETYNFARENGIVMSPYADLSNIHQSDKTSDVSRHSRLMSNLGNSLITTALILTPYQMADDEELEGPGYAPEPEGYLAEAPDQSVINALLERESLIEAKAPLLLEPASAKIDQRALDHVLERHWSTSVAKGTGKFLSNITASSLKSMIETATTKGAFKPNTYGRPGTIAEYDFGKVIGTTSTGNPATNLRVVISPNGNVVTVFPF